MSRRRRWVWVLMLLSFAIGWLGLSLLRIGYRAIPDSALFVLQSGLPFQDADLDAEVVHRAQLLERGRREKWLQALASVVRGRNSMLAVYAVVLLADESQFNHYNKPALAVLATLAADPNLTPKARALCVRYAVVPPTPGPAGSSEFRNWMLETVMPLENREPLLERGP